MDKTFLGTEIKYLVEISASGFSMVDDDFEITLKRGSISRTFRKEDLVHSTEFIGGEEKDNYYLCFDTEEFGKGEITAIVKAYVPDSDFDDGIRTEVDKFNLINVIV